MNTSDVPVFKKTGFDNTLYKRLQTEEILKRVSKISSGHLYLEIGGKLFNDPHAARVLPGFDPKIKIDILKSLNIPFDIIFCMNYADILSNRQLNNHKENYIDSSLEIISNLQTTFGVTAYICINNVKSQVDKNEEFISAAQSIYEKYPNVFFRYYIDGYPDNSEKILSPDGFGKDSKIPVTQKLVIVTGSASNSGKLSTCLGMVYQDSLVGMNSDYAKYETFPIWNLPLKHPANLAYEAATADIGDKNVLDTYYQLTYGKEAVNYNRDVQAFGVVKKLMKSEYNSPTDMGISNAGFAITNDEVVCIAALEEIKRRKEWYKEINSKQAAWVKVCEELETDAMKYITDKKYNPNLELV
jgi:uncharacterized protein (UPF0371 family)